MHKVNSLTLTVILATLIGTPCLAQQWHTTNFIGTGFGLRNAQEDATNKLWNYMRSICPNGIAEQSFWTESWNYAQGTNYFWVNEHVSWRCAESANNAGNMYQPGVQPRPITYYDPAHPHSQPPIRIGAPQVLTPPRSTNTYPPAITHGGGTVWIPQKPPDRPPDPELPYTFPTPGYVAPTAPGEIRWTFPR